MPPAWGMGNGDVRVGARYGAIDISHEKMVVEKRTNLSTPEHVIFARRLDGDSRGAGDDAWRWLVEVGSRLSQLLMSLMSELLGGEEVRTVRVA